ncbi:MAG: nicotinate-nucleotide--dimethylbenzimidazole phosphoribosyltransferase [Opitutales bacterium]
MITSEEIQRKIDEKTKPPGSLGRLEELAFQIATVQQTLDPVLQKPAIIVFAGDHGIADEPVSAFPKGVTRQMVINFLRGGAAINVFCRTHGISLKIVDAGVCGAFPGEDGLIQAKVREGTRNFLFEPAMTGEEVDICFRHAEEIVEGIASGNNVLGFGEMGIGNTSSAALLMSALSGAPVNECVGRGTGVNDEQLAGKIAILETAKARHPATNDPMRILATFGGYEIAQICGAMLAGYRRNKILLIDGFIASVAFLTARRIEPEIRRNAIFCHESQEKGHRRLLKLLDAKPILHLNMRLGEGSGCALAWPIIQNAVAFFNEMASFTGAGVSQSESEK